MKNKLTCHLFRKLACLGTVILMCSSAWAQNLFVSNGYHSPPESGNIYEFGPDGVRTTFASGLDSTVGLALDSAGNLFVTDISVSSTGIASGTIYKFTPDGVRSTFASGLDYTFGVAFDSAGNLFVSDYTGGLGGSINGTIYKFTPDGVRSTFALGLSFPTALAFDRTGNLFVRDGGSNRILKFTPEGVPSTFASGSELNTTTGLACDGAGNLFVSEYGSGVKGGTLNGVPIIYKFTPSGVRTTFAFPSQLNGPTALAFDSAGNLFVSDDTVTDSSEEHTFPGAIYKFTPDGQRSTFAANLFGFPSIAFQPPLTATATLANISTRGSVETGKNVLIGGFIVTGSDPMPVIIRGLGSTLTSFGVPDALQDPVLELHNTTSMMTSNDDWQSAANANQIPMNYRPADSRESAVMITLQPGTYTAVMHGKNSTTGNGLLEVYSTLSGLTNVSTRGFVGTGDNLLIGGFISSGGNDSIQLIIRALGPTLTQFGVSGALADPTLSLIDGNGNVVAFNDNWKNTQKTAIQNTGFAPPNDLESAILATLTNGNYTTIVSGKNGATGVGLVEVYKVALVANQ